MSVYLLTHRETPSGGAESYVRMASAQGFRVLSEEPYGPWTLRLLAASNGSGIVRVEPRPGVTLIAVGLFLFRDLSGPEALHAFYDAFEGRPFDWRETHGHFTLLRIENEEILVLTDGLGAHKTYHDEHRKVFSNSFLAALCCLQGRRLDPLGAHVYAFAGSCYGGRTFVDGLSFLSANSLLHLGATADVSPGVAAIAGNPETQDLDLAEAVAVNLEALRSIVARLAAAAKGRVRLSFSGGYDSRLLLALLLEQDVRPELYVYGKTSDIDVRIATEVAKAEGLTLRHVDKGRVPTPDGDDFAAAVEAALVQFDGWKNTGLFDNGADVPDRHSRHEGGFLPVNGGLGEIYRNFFSLRDRPYRAEHVVASFYRGFDPRWARDRGAIADYNAELARRMREQLGVGPGYLSSQQAQLLYPLFRGRFWTAREAEINQRFGPMAFPFLEHDAIRVAARVPLALKNYGRLQAAMIVRVSPRLAALPTGYGFPFDAPPGWRYRLDTVSTLMRPIWLRRHIGALNRRRRFAGIPSWLREDRLRLVMDPSLPFVGPLFAIERITHADTLNRIITMDYLAQRFGFAG